MRPMQAKVYEERNHQYILIKAPPASGKSRALMFVALDKLINQGLKKVIVAVPETAIGSSFKDTDLTTYGFYSDWTVEDKYNLCGIEFNDSVGTINTLISFLDDPKSQILVCTHATLRGAYKKITTNQLDSCVLAVDEFHHASASGDNQLGNLIDGVMNHSSAHVIAMTGSYFRGDTVPILLSQDEAKFQQVTYSYYEQLNSYQYLKSLGIGYHFYTGNYLTAIGEVLNPNKKTIIHIPNVNSRESTGDKYLEVEYIISKLGEEISRENSDIINVRLHNSDKVIKVANLVEDSKTRPEVLGYLRNIKHRDDMDIIIALGMAKEGFDWEYCEHALTIGYRSSMTEVIQIIGRATRDSEGKTHAQFTNLIAQPDAEDEEVQYSVNNMIKAITVSLLMEQVLAPAVNFKARSDLKPGEEVSGNTIIIDDVDSPLSPEAKKVLANQDNIQAKLLQDVKTMGRLMTNQTLPEVLLNVDLPKLIREESPNLSENEVETLAEVIFKQLVIQGNGGVVNEEDLPEDAEPYIPGLSVTVGETTGGEKGDAEPDKKFILLGNKFINIADLHVDLIKEINPFQNAFEILSKSVDEKMLKTLQDVVKGMKSTMRVEEAMALVERIAEFKAEHDRLPSISSVDDYESHLGEAVECLRKERQRQMSEENGV